MNYLCKAKGFNLIKAKVQNIFSVLEKLLSEMKDTLQLGKIRFKYASNNIHYITFLIN